MIEDRRQDLLIMNIMAISSANDDIMNAMAVDFQLHDSDDNVFDKWNGVDDFDIFVRYFSWTKSKSNRVKQISLFLRLFKFCILWIFQ